MEGIENEIIIAIISAIFGGVITYITSLILEKRKEKREDRIEAHKERKLIFENRPELEIVDYKDYIKRTGYGTKQKCDVNVIVARIENVIISGEKKYKRVEAQYRVEDFNPDDWCCVIYTFKNVGKTDISAMDIICNYKKDTCIFDCDSSASLAANNLLNYSVCLDKKVRVGEVVTVKFCYHKDRIVSGMLSAIMSIGLEDCNGRHWMQPLFAPTEKIYDSRMVSYKDYISEVRVDAAIECFKNPMLW
jgi:hypothetical protein